MALGPSQGLGGDSMSTQPGVFFSHFLRLSLGAFRITASGFRDKKEVVGPRVSWLGGRWVKEEGRLKKSRRVSSCVWGQQWFHSSPAPKLLPL